ncbi:claudin-23-like [Boleophthalmus pectinirostris]|uniref:claudin-23-like n=1 Tax=Boleophthalmus pectinirostris TaxID=150288 RepID=UPI00242CDB05|nr:claudin-23-like [Boleophthalmus pectinirostris]
MSNRGKQEWIRESMRTPGILIFGMVLAPCGLILNLTSTVAPNWRTLHNLPNSASGFTVMQGIWDICTTTSSSSYNYNCGQEDSAYFGHQVIEVAQGMMVASLIVTLVGLIVAIPGVRCWKNNPNWTVAGLAGLLIFISGVLTIIPIAWYTHILEEVTSVPPSVTVQVGYCIILGYIGGIMEVLAGLVMFIGICRCCGGKNRGEVRVEQPQQVSRAERPKPAPRRTQPPSLSRPRSELSSVAYSSNYDDVSIPRAKTTAWSVDSGVNRKPYDADL